MSRAQLITLLTRIRDGAASADEIARVGESVAGEEGIPPDLLPGLFAEEAEADAAGLLMLLGEQDDLGTRIAEAVRHEAGSPAADAEWDDGWSPIRDALRGAFDEEAAAVDVVGTVLSGIGVDETPVPVAEAVRAEAGDVDVAAAVMARIGAGEALPVAEAVRAEAGGVDVAEAVLRAVTRSAVAPPVEVPRPANTSSGWMRGLLAFAAAALVAVVGGTTVLLDGRPSAYDLQFASAGEIVVDELDYSEAVSVQVFQEDGENAPLIIWVDEGTAS